MADSQIGVYDNFFSIISEYLSGSDVKTSKLYFKDRLCCLSIYRGLSNANKKFIMKHIVFHTQPYYILSKRAIIKLLDEFCSDNSENCLNEMIKLRIIQINDEVYDESMEITYKLNKNFLRNLRLMLLGHENGSTKQDNGIYLADTYSGISFSKHHHDVIEIENYTKESWSKLLAFISNAGQINWRDYISYELLSVFLLSSIVNYDSNSNEVCITSTGFRFLLLVNKSQLLTMIYYLIMWMNLKFTYPPAKTITFLLTLSEYGSNSSFTLTDNTEYLLPLVKLLNELGLIFKDVTDDIYYISDTLVNSVKFENIFTNTNNEMMIVEKNFKIYCYNFSPILISTVALFAEILYTFPSMIVGRISRESSLQAFTFGISPSQIVKFVTHYVNQFLKAKALPNLTVIPECVREQLDLWDKECNRIKSEPGVLYKNFSSISEFEDLLNFCESNKYILAFNRDKRFIIVTQDSHSDVRKFWKIKKN